MVHFWGAAPNLVLHDTWSVYELPGYDNKHVWQDGRHPGSYDPYKLDGQCNYPKVQVLCFTDR